MNETHPDNILTIQTVQIAPFRTLMTALKDILLETNITFSKEGMFNHAFIEDKLFNLDKPTRSTATLLKQKEASR